MEEPRLIKKNYKDILKQKKVLIIMSIFVLIILIGPSYALLSNFKKLDNAVNVTTANMNMSITQSSSITLEEKLPESDASGLLNATPVSVTVKNANTGPFTNTETTKFQNQSASTIKIVKYELKLVPDTNQPSTLDNQYIKYAVSTDNGTTYSQPKKVSESNTIVFTGYNIDLGQTKTILLKLWIDEDSGSNGTNKNYYGSIQVEMYQNATIPAAEAVKANIKSNNTSSDCQNATLTWTDPEDGITYISGSKTCVDFNYLWYSGKMWRITSIYPDGAMKLVTENPITDITWGSNIEYDGSWMYQWLNEDFYDTLINPTTFLKTDATWNYSTDGSSTPVRPETIETQKTKTASVGLLNAYEYYNSYRCNGSSDCSGSSYYYGYLKIGYYWWLITPYSSGVRYVSYIDNLRGSSPSSNSFGARPSIILQSEISLSGSGTKTDPYKLVGNNYTSGSAGDNLNSRYSGEYVNFDGDKYRIISIDNSITKITSVDYLRNGTSVLGKNFASSSYFGKSSNTQEDTFWDYYLNNTWYNSITSTYKNMIVDGTYYLGLYLDNTNYKATICKDSNLNEVTTKNCSKYTSSDTDKTYTGKVGLPRVGEMFSAQLRNQNGSTDMWLITPYSDSDVRYVYFGGSLKNISPSSNSYGARPSINLSSAVKITCNSSVCDGTEQYPYDLTM